MITIVNYQTVLKGVLVGYVDVIFDTGKGKMIIEHIQHLKKGEMEWLSFPAYYDQTLDTVGNGAKMKFKPYVHFLTPETDRAFLGAVKTALKARLEEKAKKAEGDTYQEVKSKEDIFDYQEQKDLKTKEELGW